ncbi:MAG: CocE/NonD family hydrolase, partial [Microbacteriaceae bacterium]|nr:CocE/NonD family hydrolase [Microbacteriaceae bacterium]
MPEIRTDVGIPMRDGTVLRADVHLPDALPAPVLVTRTAYGKHTGIALTADTAALVARGYAVVVQDKRGLHASDGRWRIMRDDRQDGHDTVEWAAAQPWSDGRVGVYGLSYLGHTAMSAAIARPPHLAAAVVMQPSTDEYSDRTFLDGVLALQNDVDWPALPFVAPALIAGLPAEERAGAEADLAAHLTGDVRYGALPLADRPYLARFPELWAGPLAHREDAGYFADTRVGAAELAHVDVPVLHVGSWFD